MSETYIHYGASVFNPVKLIPPASYRLRPDKPYGLWASPVDSDLNWYDWCLNEDFRTERLFTSFKFNLTDVARVLHIRTLKDVENYICIRGIPYSETLNFRKLYHDYDAMELHLSENWSLRDFHLFYTWDVDSIVVWNPLVIKQIRKGENERTYSALELGPCKKRMG